MLTVQQPAAYPGAPRQVPRDVLCSNPLCRFTLKRGRRAWLGEHSGHGRAKCPECRQLTTYDHR